MCCQRFPEPVYYFVVGRLVMKSLDCNIKMDPPLHIDIMEQYASVLQVQNYACNDTYS